MHEECSACGFDGSRYVDDALLDALRGLGPKWRDLLGTAGDLLRERPGAGVWSAIEYAAHSRDVTAMHVYGVEQALTGDEPVLPAIDDEVTEAAAATYGDADPDEVAAALGRKATRLAAIAASAGISTWSRGLTVGDTRADVRRLLEHALHDSTHHLDDVERGLASLRAAQA